MFQPPVFREDRTEVIHQQMHLQPFASLLTSQNGEMTADHIPMALHPELSSLGTLRGHVARGNPMGKSHDPSKDCLVLFQGAYRYITPSWYPSKKEHDKVVPTWNYISVHARGKINLIYNEGWILSHLTDLTHRLEKTREDPWQVSDAPDAFIARQLKGIIGIEIEISHLQGTWKASQNKSQIDSAGVVSGLLSEPSRGGCIMAKMVQDRSA